VEVLMEGQELGIAMYWWKEGVPEVGHIHTSRAWGLQFLHILTK
jgi:hypothetical protein